MRLVISSILEEHAIATRASEVIDCSAWVGQYPFRSIRCVDAESMRELLTRLGIKKAVVSPYEALFQENNLDAYARFAADHAANALLEVWPVLRPGHLHGLRNLLDRYRPCGLRLVPTYHGYHLFDAAVAPIFEIARERGMIVQIFTRIADERWHWMLKVPELPADELDYAATVYANQPIIVSGLNAPQTLAPRMRQHPSLYADVSRVRGPVFAMEKLVETVPPDRLVFGSLWPIQMIEATLWQVTSARISERAREGILASNARSLMASAFRE